MKTNIFSLFFTLFILYVVLAEYELIKKHSDTILGRFILVACVIFYTSIDKYFGLFFSLIIILFLQDQFIEGMLNLDDANYRDEHTKSTFSSFEKQEILKYYKSCPVSNTDIQSLYTHSTILNKPNKYNEDFKQHNCKNMKLKYKSMDVPDDMVRHIFPSLQFHNETCNICNNNCKFSITDSKLKTTKELEPKNTTFV